MDYQAIYTETLFGLDYPTLWFLVIGAVFTGYAILDGFDLGAGATVHSQPRPPSYRFECSRSGMGWERSLVGDRWWCALCWIPKRLRIVVFWIVHSVHALFGHAHLPSGKYRISFEREDVVVAKIVGYDLHDIFGNTCTCIGRSDGKCLTGDSTQRGRRLRWHWLGFHQPLCADCRRDNPRTFYDARCFVFGLEN